MSKAQHTPGPWITRGWDIFAGPLHIATAVYIGYEENVGEAERDTNARLIAAAPELLEALETVLQMDVKGHELQDRLQFSEKGR